MSLPDVLLGPEVLREALATHALPSDLQDAFDRAESSLRQSLAAIQQSLERLDKTLLEAAANAGSKMQHQLEQLRSRAARAELRQSEVVGRHAELLSNNLYPNKVLQEREIGGVYFMARHGVELLHGLYDTLRTDCLDHQIITSVTLSVTFITCHPERSAIIRLRMFARSRRTPIEKRCRQRDLHWAAFQPESRGGS